MLSVVQYNYVCYFVPNFRLNYRTDFNQIKIKIIYTYEFPKRFLIRFIIMALTVVSQMQNKTKEITKL